ncbi:MULTISPECIES: MDR family MFS transporter [unclassified Mesorhizobium]|uniref:MDR family MFS transporter n=2 Tax=Mesorhizobium TaxID=68287 RepID=UPI000BAF7BC0|nr:MULTISPECIES: MDR family MFS transporter [unclassified Mesorhizobium]PBB31047.1 MFS transporter [Mesorhizobium sp. WSM3882]RUV87456.1 MFS transporter [Mesorhizobium sp. M1A.F.Ca.IN.020.32.1.1]RUW09419.1 MFS transporter [Mesorhizobium sp. M1A.F.Ca.IN.022.05.2.1]RWF77220.1 MAG: MFS transporter [Mesorhizobium sp.]RWF98173.1 MAG: MFS transporter [Mesorhizobium sp.]
MDQTVDNRTTMRTMASPSISESEKNAIIGGVLLSMLLAALDQTIVSPALPTIARALGHAEYLPWIVTGYLLTATAMAPLYGKISDVYGRRPVIYAAILIFLLGSLVSALAPDMLVLVIGRAIQGAGGGGLFALTQTVIGDLVPPRERARYAAWISGTWAVASVAGPLLGGVFAEHLHWSLIFWINLPIGFLAMAIINNPLKKLPIAAKHHRIDGLGAVLLVIATALLLLALNWGGSTYPWFSPEILGLVACSAAFWALFALRLLRASEPLISLEVLGNRIVLAGTLSMFLLQAANIGASVYLPVYLQSVVGLSVSESGIAMLGLLLGTVAGATFSGRMIPRFVHYKRIAMVGVSLAIACIGVLSAIATHASLLEVEILTTLIGLGSGTTFPVSTVSVQNAVDRAHLGVATGVLTFLRTLGGALGVALLGAVALGYGLPLAAEGSQTHIELTSAMPFVMIFLTAGITLVLALTALALMPEKPLRGKDEHAAPVLAE